MRQFTDVKQLKFALCFKVVPLKDNVIEESFLIKKSVEVGLFAHH